MCVSLTLANGELAEERGFLRIHGVKISDSAFSIRFLGGVEGDLQGNCRSELISVAGFGEFFCILLEFMRDLCRRMRALEGLLGDGGMRAGKRPTTGDVATISKKVRETSALLLACFHALHNPLGSKESMAGRGEEEEEDEDHDDDDDGGGWVGVGLGLESCCGY